MKIRGSILSKADRTFSKNRPYQSSKTERSIKYHETLYNKAGYGAPEIRPSLVFLHVLLTNSQQEGPLGTSRSLKKFRKF